MIVMSRCTEEGEWDDMDNMDWVNFIDELHCTDYWYDENDYDPKEDNDEDDSDSA
jgi:hypothetical protein